jgi:hypothetical protein
MASFIILSDEVLLNIFEQLSASSSSALLSAMRVCRTWHRVIASVLYRHVELQIKLRQDCTASRFARQSFARQLHHYDSHLVHSLALEFTQVHLMGLSIGSIESWQRVLELQGLLPQLKSLRSFTVSLEKPPSQGFILPSPTVIGVLNCLPRTVVNLNVDCESLYDPGICQSHLCGALADLMPGLKRLRLRVSHLCDSFLMQKSDLPSTLEYAMIRLDMRPYSQYGTKTCCCYGDGEPTRAVELAATVQNLQKDGRFPNLRRFAIIEREDAGFFSARNDHWNTFRIRELTKNTATTTSFPWRPRGGSSSLFMIRDQGGDWFGSFDEVSSSLEGDMSWTDHRRQRTFAPGGDWRLDHTQLAPRQVVTQKFGVSFQLWRHEKLTGAKHLDVRTTTGLDDAEPMCEIIPPGWVWAPGDSWDWTIVPIGHSL